MTTGNRVEQLPATLRNPTLYTTLRRLIANKAFRQLIREPPTSKYGIHHQHQGLQEDGSEVPEAEQDPLRRTGECQDHLCREQGTGTEVDEGLPQGQRHQAQGGPGEGRRTHCETHRAADEGR